jgi:hypothetical protein
MSKCRENRRAKVRRRRREEQRQCVAILGDAFPAWRAERGTMGGAKTDNAKYLRPHSDPLRALGIGKVLGHTAGLARIQLAPWA